MNWITWKWAVVLVVSYTILWTAIWMVVFGRWA